MLQAIAPCKVNLYLKVIEKREDGYHSIDTVFLPLQSPYDEIIWSPAPGFERGLTLTVNNAPEIPDDSSNLVYQAAIAYARKARISPNWHIELTKNIPSSAGLGGGSADAAATLMLLEEAFGFISKEELWYIARNLGADVPFFLESTPARAMGIGDVITPIKDIIAIPPILVAAPEFPVSSVWAYNNLDPERICAVEEEYPEALIKALQDADFLTLGEMLHNDLEFAVLDKFPITAHIKQRMLQTGATGAIVSGSGPSLFGIFPDKQTRDEAAGILVNEMPNVAFYIPPSASI
jgi:4-diphosphocytidyl-2-C-methyl-D-erythritol kinase